MTQDRSSWEKERSRPIDGSATLTIEASSTTTNCAAASRTSASQRLSGDVDADDTEISWGGADMVESLDCEGAGHIGEMPTSALRSGTSALSLRGCVEV